MRKRQKMVLSAILLATGLFVAQSVSLEWRYASVGLLAAASWLLAAWSLREGLSGVEWLTVLLPTVAFTVGVGLFYVLLPEAWWARALIVLLFGVGQYALLLSANIFSVAAIRTIALARAAAAVEFAMTLLTAFFLYDTVFSFRLPFWQVGWWVSVASLGLLLPGLWSVKLEPKLTAEVRRYAIWLTGAMGVLAAAISFWPIGVAVSSLFLCTMLYIYLGITQHYFSERLFPRTMWEYVTVGVVVLITVLVTAGTGV